MSRDGSSRECSDQCEMTAISSSGEDISVSRSALGARLARRAICSFRAPGDGGNTEKIDMRALRDVAAARSLFARVNSLIASNI